MRSLSVLLVGVFLSLGSVGVASQKELVSTRRIPHAHGTARLEPLKGGGVAIDLKISGLKPAVMFGGDYSTYVLWMSPDGDLRNFGELTLDGDSSRMRIVSEMRTGA